MERGNLSADVKGKRRVGYQATSANIDAEGRGGAVHSSDEASVTDVERRDCVVL